MEYDRDKVDEATLALMWLVMWKEKPPSMAKAWKGFDWDTLDRLHAKGYISDPKGKAKSVYVSEEGEQRAEELFRQLFSQDQDRKPK